MLADKLGVSVFKTATAQRDNAYRSTATAQRDSACCSGGFSFLAVC